MPSQHGRPATIPTGQEEPKVVSAAETAPRHQLSELEQPEWSIICFSGLIAGGLTYSQATKIMHELGNEGVPGLCVTTDVAALMLLDDH